jgi:putative phosphoribosyl transferase
MFVHRLGGVFIFQNRRDAGRQLAQRFDRFAGREDVIVLALPRGGVPVGYEVARRIEAPLDVLVVRKLGVPGHEELAMGAIASGGIRVIDHRTVQLIGLTPEELDHVVDAEEAELMRRERLYRARSADSVTGKVTILVDDGLATGSTMMAAIDAVKTRDPARLIVGVPVAPPETCKTLSQQADALVCLATPDPMYAVGVWYEDFTQTSDEEVRELLDRADRERRMRRQTMHYEGAR